MRLRLNSLVLRSWCFSTLRSNPCFLTIVLEFISVINSSFKYVENYLSGYSMKIEYLISYIVYSLFLLRVTNPLAIFSYFNVM